MRIHGMALAAAGLMLGACGSRSPQLTPVAERYLGTYRFTGRDASAQPILTVEGTFTILPDAITVSLVNGPCISTPGQAPWAVRRSSRFECGPIRIEIGHEDPVRRSSFSMTGTTTRTERICTRFEILPNGNRVCVTYGESSVQVDRTYGGALKVAPVPPSPGGE